MPYKDKKKQAESSRKHYEKNKCKVKKRAYVSNIASRKRNKKYVRDILLNSKCVDCGNDDIRVLDFDHVRGHKRNNISTMVHTAYSLNAIKDEMSKCEIRCANCHRIKTYKDLYK